MFTAVEDQQHSQLQQVLQRLRERFGQLIIMIASLIGPPRPQKIQVTTGPDAIPRALVWPDRIVPVRSIYEHWRESRFWWAQPVKHYYYRIEDNKGQVRVIYRDLRGETWWLDRRSLEHPPMNSPTLYRASRPFQPQPSGWRALTQRPGHPRQFVRYAGPGSHRPRWALRRRRLYPGSTRRRYQTHPGCRGHHGRPEPPHAACGEQKRIRQPVPAFNPGASRPAQGHRTPEATTTWHAHNQGIIALTGCSKGAVASWIAERKFRAGARSRTVAYRSF